MWSSLIGVGGVVLIGLLGRRVGGRRVGLVAAAIAACYPMLFQTSALGFSESLYVAVAAAVLLVAYQVYDRPTIWRWILLGVLIGLAALTRGEGGALLVLVAWPLAWWCASDWRGRLVPAATVTMATLVVITPWMIRNLNEFNRFVPISTNGATAIAGANCDTTYSGRWIGSWHLRVHPRGVRVVQEHESHRIPTTTNPSTSRPRSSTASTTWQTTCPSCRR